MAVAQQAMAAAPVGGRARGAEQAEARPVALPALTGLRFVAALLVVGVHFWRWLPLPPLLHTIISRGSIGPSLFFVLSGFVLAYSYRSPAGTVRGGAHAFYRARVARLYPLYLCGIGLALLTPDPWWGTPTPLALGLTLGLVQSWLPGQHVLVNSPAWSLSVEAFFYLLLPVLLPWCARLRPAARLRWGATLWLGQIALQAILARVWTDAAVCLPLVRLPEFVCGLLLGCQWAESGALPVAGWMADLLVGGALTLALLLLPATPILATGGALLTPVWAVLLYLLAGGRGRCARLLARPAATLLGEASYALYILHFPLWCGLTALLGLSVGQATASAPCALLYTMGAVAAAVLAYRLVERPARRSLLARARHSA